MPFPLHNKYGAYSNRKHGHSAGGKLSPTYLSWRGMLARCRAKSGYKFTFYAGRGITVCERWQSFENFLADMGERPVGMVLDRIDNAKGYEPANCRWATLSQSMRNRRKMKRKLKTHCKRGHLFDTRNSRQQICRQCNAIRMLRFKLRHRLVDSLPLP